MDKKFIHIDDLSRQLLGQREEEPRPGAWVTMRELLDKEMPVGTLPVAGFAWKRYLSAALVLLLISITTIGSYHLSVTQPASNAMKGLADAATQLPAAASSNQAPALSEAAALPAASAISNNAAAQGASGFPALATTDELSAVAASSAPATPLFTLPMSSTEKSPVSKKPVGRQLQTHQGMIASSGLPAKDDAPLFRMQQEGTQSYAAGMPHTAGSSSEEGPTIALASMPAALEKAETRPAHKPAPANKQLANNTASERAPGKNKAAKPEHQPELQPGSNSLASTGVSKAKNRQPAAPKKQMVLVRDTIQQIQIVQKMVPSKTMRGFELKFDTISIKDLVQERWVQAGTAYQGIGPMPHTGEANVQTVNAAPPQLQTEDGMGRYVALSSRQVSSRKWNAKSITLKDRLEKAMFQLSEMRTYTGLVAGLSATPFNKTSTYGFQLGLSQTFQLDPEWSVIAEFKYSRRMGKDLLLRDDYAASYGMNRQIQGSNTIYNWQQDSVEHYFKVSALQSVIVPVSLQYNLKRVFLMGGINFSYSPRVNSEEITRWHNQPAAHTYTGNANYMQMPPGYQEGLPSVKIDDFGSRISLGYQFGLGYELTPALKLDVRCSQQFWDNSSTPGARKVSKEFFRLPNVQLSVGYKFGKGK